MDNNNREIIILENGMTVTGRATAHKNHICASLKEPVRPQLADSISGGGQVVGDWFGERLPMADGRWLPTGAWILDIGKNGLACDESIGCPQRV